MKALPRTLLLFLLAVSFLGAVHNTVPNCSREITTVQDVNLNHMKWFQVPCVQSEGWDTAHEVIFWRRVITLEKDSSMANVHETRQLLRAFSRGYIDTLEQRGMLDSLRHALCIEYRLPTHTRVKFTAGKKWFYNFSGVVQHLGRAIKVFDSLGVDPFYAQSVLLIESPGTNKAKSVSGAYGHFQLMPFVARQYGLRVDKYLDERENFNRSAYAAARLFKEICVPYAKRWCVLYGFEADENALWFKLLVLHCYNAGAGNVKKAMAVIPTSYQGKEFIQKLWHTNQAAFQTEAQNYSQIALACYLEFERHISTYKQVSSELYSRF